MNSCISSVCTLTEKRNLLDLPEVAGVTEITLNLNFYEIDDFYWPKICYQVTEADFYEFLLHVLPVN